MINRWAGYLFTAGMFASFIIGCKDEMSYNNSTTTPFKVVNVGHNVGLDEDVIFIHAGISAKGNPEFTYYTASHGFTTTEIDENGHASITAQSDPSDANKPYEDNTLVLPKKYSSYEITKHKSFPIALTNYGASFAGGMLDIGDSVDFDVEIRFTQRRDATTTATSLAYLFVTATWLSPTLPLENPSEYSLWSLDNGSELSAWDVTHNQRLVISARSFPDQISTFGFTFDDYIPRTYWPVCGNHICICSDGSWPCEYAPGASFVVSREYIFVSRQHYSDKIDPRIAANGGHLFKLAYALWPYSNEDLGTGNWYNTDFYRSLPTFESGSYFWLRISKIKPGLIANLNNDTRYKNFIYDQGSGTLSIASAKTIDDVSLQGITQLDLSFKQKKTKIHSLVKDSTKQETLHNHGLFKTGDGFTSAVTVEVSNQSQNKIRLIRLNSSLDTLFTAQINQVQLSQINADFVPFFFDEDGHTIFFLFDVSKHSIVKYEFSNSAIVKVWEQQIIVGSPLPSGLINVLSYSPGHYVALLDNATLYTMDPAGLIDNVTIALVNPTQMRLCGDNSRLLFTAVSVFGLLVMYQFDLTSHHFGKLLSNTFNLGSGSVVINHFSGFVPDGALTVLELKTTSSSTEQIFFKTDNSLKVISGK